MIPFISTDLLHSMSLAGSLFGTEQTNIKAIQWKGVFRFYLASNSTLPILLLKKYKYNPTWPNPNPAGQI